MNVDVEDEQLDRMLHALADPTRRAILRRLGEGDAQVTTLAEPFAISLNSVSKHIRTLESAGLVLRRRAGRGYLLSLHPQGLDHVTAWLDDTRRFWSRRLAALDDLLTERAREHEEPR
jgi:DNA-binding transcriptional ArsR family regulator